MGESKESKAIEAGIRAYHKISGIDLSTFAASIPDEANRRTKDIDRLFTFGYRRIALEHSKVEAYPGQVEYLNISHAFAARISGTLQKVLLKDRSYSVIIPPELVIGKKKKHMDRLANAIRQELVSRVHTLDTEDDHTFEFDEYRIRIYCERLDGLEKGRLYSTNTVPRESLDVLFPLRIKTLFNEKLPKLIRYKLLGIKTILLIEDVAWKTGHGFPKTYVGTWNMILTWFFVDTVIFVRSNNGEMIFCNVWKHGLRWPRAVPDDFKIDTWGSK